MDALNGAGQRLRDLLDEMTEEDAVRAFSDPRVEEEFRAAVTRKRRA